MDAQFSFELLDNGSNENNAMRLIELSLRISFQNSEKHFLMEIIFQNLLIIYGFKSFQIYKLQN